MLLRVTSGLIGHVLRMVSTASWTGVLDLFHVRGISLLVGETKSMAGKRALAWEHWRTRSKAVSE